MQEGMVADVVVLDPNEVVDNATYSQGTLPTTGIPFVLVNGKTVVREGKVLSDVYPGKPIRFAAETDGRFEPLDESGWAPNNLTAPTGFYGLDKVEN